MVAEGAAPVDHKKDDQRQRQIQKQKHDAAASVPLQLCGHIRTGLAAMGIACQREPHHTHEKVIARQGAIPEGAVINAEAKLKNRVNGIPDKAAKQAHIHPQANIAHPDLHILVFVFEISEKGKDSGDPAAPKGEGISRQHVGCNGKGVGLAQHHHAVNQQPDGHGEQDPEDRHMRKQQCFSDFL